MTRLWCELAWLGGERAEPGVLVEVDGDRIVAARPGAPPGDAQRLAGLTLPGLANAHSHSFQRALRGRTHGANGSFWTWREQMYALAATLDPDSYLDLARATFAEMALAGITLVGEFHYLHHAPDGTPYDDPNTMGEAVIAAAGAAGVRLTLLDACYLRGGLPSFRDESADAWAARVDELRESATVRIGAAIHSVRAVDPASAAAVADWVGERPLHAHVSEQAAENEACLDAYGLTPTEVLADAGAISDRFTAVHGTQLAEEDIGRLGAAGATCCLCPTTERDLADGIGPARAMIDAGARLALGSDSHALIDLFEEARAVELDERLETGFRGAQSPTALLRAATENGHACLGWPDAGRIEAGARADLVTVGLGSVRLAGTDRQSALASLVFAASAADVRSVIVDDRQVVRDGAHVEIDVGAELRAAIEAAWR